MKKDIIQIILLMLSLNLMAQKQANNWALGNYQLDFNSGQPEIKFHYADYLNRGIGIISDNSGSLLFYSDGFSVWNKSHHLMLNGTELISSQRATSTQESLVIPDPGNSHKYYLFTVDPWNGQENSGLYYSTIDLSLDKGLGDISTKGIKILNKVTNKISATYHENLQDFWILVHEHNTNNYYSFLITSEGISKPIFNKIGKTHDFWFGQLKFSTDGKKVACSRSYESPGDTSFDLFDFDPSTGVLSNAMAFDLPANRNCAGIDFSPDSKKLYVAQTGSTGESGLYQFNIQLSSQVAIQNSRKLLHKEIHNGFRQLQLAPDGKIYITKSGGGGGTEYLGVISQLNELADNVVVEENGLYLEGGSSFVNSTPNFIQNYLFKTSFSYEGTCQSVQTQFEITNTYQLKSVEWSFGEGSTSTEINPEFVYEKEGIYTVVLIVNYADHSDVITKKVKIDPFPILELGNGLSSSNPHLLKCKDQSTSIFVTAQNIKAYQWYYKPTQNDHFVLLDDEDQSSVVADKEGIYYCRLLGNSCYIDSPEFNVEEEKMDVKILNVSPQYICSANFTSISINSVAGKETIWFFRPPYINSFEKIGVGEDLIIKNEGEYFCKVIGQNCEFYSDTLSVLSSDKTINIEPIEAICNKNKIIYLKASPEGGKWSGPGIADQDVGILDPSGLLNGRYQIEYLIQQNGCNNISRIEFVLDNLAFPRLEYEDTDICLSKAPVLTIDNYLEFEQFEWYMISDKVGKLVERGNSMKIQEIGKYYVQAFKHSCMIASDTVSFEALTSIINVPNVFTPNGDAVNENFYLNTENIEDFKLKILNRWGKLVFSTNSITNYWEANDSPPGIYYWFINYRGLSK